MRDTREKTVTIIFIFILLAGVMFLINIFNLSLIENLKIKDPGEKSAAGLTPKAASRKFSREAVKDKYLRKERLDVSREYSQSVIYEDGVEIARFKTKNHKTYDAQGEIPGGNVKFVNESKGTYGIEQYRRGKRNGDYAEYYREGQIKKKAYYFNGKIMRVTEYYIDGTVRMEVDYTDNLMFTDDIEVGVGKVYYRDGVLMYEWSLTNSNPIRYKISYNKKGELVETKYYDDKGDLIERINHRKK